MDDHSIDGARRHFVKLAAGGALVAASPMFARIANAAGTRTLKIGYVSPQTGPLAPFGEADRFIIEQMQTALKAGISINGKQYPVAIVVKDSQSNPNRAGEVANDLILKDKVDIMLVSGTPETANPVSDACEINEMPCVSTVVPWQPWFFGRKGDPKKGFRFTYHFFWGLEDVIAVYTGMWQSVQTNKSVGGLFPNDGDGNAWGDSKLGFPPVLAQKGFTLKDPGRFQSMTQVKEALLAASGVSSPASEVSGTPQPPPIPPSIGPIHQPPPPPRRPPAAFRPARAIEKMIQMTKSISHKLTWDECSRTVARGRTGGWPESVTPRSSAMSFANIHAAVSIAALYLNSRSSGTIARPASPARASLITGSSP